MRGGRLREVVGKRRFDSINNYLIPNNINNFKNRVYLGRRGLSYQRGRDVRCLPFKGVNFVFFDLT